MTYTIRWKDCKQSDAVESFVAEKIARFADLNFVKDETQVKVEIVYYAKNKEYKTRINLPIPKKGTLRGEASDNDVLTSINKCVDKIIDQCRRVKTQYQNR